MDSDGFSVQPLEGHPCGKIEEPDREEHPELAQGQVREQAEALFIVEPLKEQGGGQGPEDAPQGLPVHPAAQQGIEEVELEEDRNEIEVGGRLAGEEVPEEPPGGQAGVPQLVDQGPDQVGGQDAEEALLQKGGVGEGLFP